MSLLIHPATMMSIKRGQALADEYNVNYKFIECQVGDFEIIKDRILKRQNMLSQIGVPTLEGFQKAKDRTLRPENIDYITLNTTDNDSFNFKEIEKYLFS